ncbi:MAG: hydrogenase iron-sulfur subunit [Thermoplasmata archaeon]|nr:MAG: hydrogenase iron-sulfur subunit [Thermoplasmata archaeon]
MKNFEPVILGFVCNECMYAAADLAGTTRQSYPSNIRLIRVPCSGQVDMIHILRAFENGADGVFVGGCLKEQCHYVDGNIKAENKVIFLKDMLKAMGMEEERLSIHFLSAAMAREFATVANELTSKIRSLGPSPLKGRKRAYPKTQKRETLHDMLLSISKGLKSRDFEYNVTISGFGDIDIDQKNCFGCGACSYVCKDGAMTVKSKANKIIIKNTYWKCTACERCVDACPKDCLDVKTEFDLNRFLKVGEEIKAEVGMKACDRCGKSYLPLMMEADIEKMLSDMHQSSDYIGFCPECRKYDQAEKLVRVHGVVGKSKAGRLVGEK